MNDPLLNDPVFKDFMSRFDELERTEFVREYEDSARQMRARMDYIDQFTTGQSLTGVPQPQHEERTGFFDTMVASAALENLSGRIIYNSDRAMSQLGWYRQLTGGEITVSDQLEANFNVDAWFEKNADIDESIREKYILGYYDDVTSFKDLAVLIGFDITEARNEERLANARGVSGFLATAAGASVDPLGVAGGMAAFRGASQGLKYLRHAGKAAETTAVSKAAGRAAFVGKNIAEGASVTAVTEAGLQLIDDDRTAAEFGVNLLVNLFADTIISSAISLGIRPAAVDVERVHMRSPDGSTTIDAEIPLSAEHEQIMRDLEGLMGEQDRPGAERQRIEQLELFQEQIEAERQAQFAEDVRADVEEAVSKGFDEAESLFGDLADEAPVSATTRDRDAVPTQPVREPEQGEQLSLFGDVERRRRAEEFRQAQARARVAEGGELNQDGPVRSQGEGAQTSPAAAELPVQPGLFDQPSPRADEAPSASGGGAPEVIEGQRGPIEPAGEGVLSPEEAELLRSIDERLRKSEAEEVTDADVLAKVNEIMSRDVQLFNYGRLDHMGLRRLKIDQPIQRAIFQTVGDSTSLEDILSALKRLPLDQKLEVIEAAGLQRAYNAVARGVQDETGVPLTSSQENDIADSLLGVGEEVASRGGRSLEEFVGSRQRDLGSGGGLIPKRFERFLEASRIEDPNDYKPDLRDDRIQRLYHRYTKLDERANAKGIVGSQLAWLSNLRGVFSKNGKLAGLAMALQSVNLTPRGVVDGVIHGRISHETSRRHIQAQARYVQGQVFRKSRKALRKMGLGPSKWNRFNPAGEMFGSDFGYEEALDPTTLSRLTSVYDFVERVRVYLFDAQQRGTFSDSSLDEALAFATNSTAYHALLQNPEQVIRPKENLRALVEQLIEVGVMEGVGGVRMEGCKVVPDLRPGAGAVPDFTSVRLSDDGFWEDHVSDLVRIMGSIYGESEEFFARLDDGILDADDIERVMRPFLTGKPAATTVDQLHAALVGDMDPANETELVRKLTDYFNGTLRGTISIRSARALMDEGDAVGSPIIFGNVNDAVAAHAQIRQLENLTDIVAQKMIEWHQIDVAKHGRADLDTRYTVKLRELDEILDERRIGSPGDDAGLQEMNPSYPVRLRRWLEDAFDELEAGAIDDGVDEPLVREFIGREKMRLGLSPHTFHKDRQDWGRIIGRNVTAASRHSQLVYLGANALADASILLSRASIAPLKPAVKNMVENIGLDLRKSRREGRIKSVVADSLIASFEDSAAVLSQRIESGMMPEAEPTLRQIRKRERLTRIHEKAAGDFINHASLNEFMTSAVKTNALMLMYHQMTHQTGGIIPLMRKALDDIDAGMDRQTAIKKHFSGWGGQTDWYRMVIGRLAPDEVRLIDDAIQRSHRTEERLVRRFGLRSLFGEQRLEFIDALPDDPPAMTAALRRFGEAISDLSEKYYTALPGQVDEARFGEVGSVTNRIITQYMKGAFGAARVLMVGTRNLSMAGRMFMLAMGTFGAMVVDVLKSWVSNRLDEKWEEITHPVSGLNWAAERYLWAGGGGFLGEKAYNIFGDMFFGSGYERYNAGRHDLAVPAQSFVLDRLIPGSQGAVKWIRGEPMTKREAEGFRRSLLAEGMLTDNLSMRLFLQTLREAGCYGEENEAWDFKQWYYEQMKVKNKD